MTDILAVSSAGRSSSSREITVAVVLTTLFALIVLGVSVAGTDGNGGAAVAAHAGSRPFLAAIVAALLAGVVYQGLRNNGWTAVPAIMLLALFGGGAGFLYLVTAASSLFPLVLLLAALIVATRRIEDTGDVQAQLSFGLIVALLPIASVAMVPLMLPLIVGGALTDREARRNPRVLLSMLLVFLVPGLIVAGGMIFVALRAGTVPLPFVSVDYWRQLAASGAPPANAAEWTRPRGFEALALLPLIAGLRPGGGRRIASTALILLLPAFLTAGIGLYHWPLPDFLPALVLGAGVIAFLATTPITHRLKFAVVLMFGLLTVGSWREAPASDDPAWRAGIMQPIAALAVLLR